MFIELVDLLRCPNEHDQTWLVASPTRMAGRHIIEGLLGCPTCRAEYGVHAGVAHFAAPARLADASAPGGIEEDALRIAALLSLTEGGATIALFGDRVHAARSVRQQTDVQVVVVNPPPDAVMGDGVSGIRCVGRLPFSTGSLSGIAFGLPGPTTQEAASAANSLSSGKRMLAPVSTILPEGIAEITRDNRDWLGEKRGAHVIHQLSRTASR